MEMTIAPPVGSRNQKAKGDAFNEALGKDIVSPLPRPQRIAAYLAISFLIVFGIYIFLIATSLLGEAFIVLTDDDDVRFMDVGPIMALTIGIFAGLLVQSSPIVTAIIALMVGEGVVSLTNGVPMILGANIGTSTTNTIVALSFASQAGPSYERAFSGAIINYMFNLLNVLLLLPLEIIVAAINPKGGGPLEEISKASVQDTYYTKEEGDSFIKTISEPIINGILETNIKTLFDLAKGSPSKDDCLQDVNFTYTFANEELEESEIQYCLNGTLIEERFDDAVDQFESSRLLKGGFLFYHGYNDKVAGICAILLGAFLLITSLTIILKTLSVLVSGPAQIYIRKMLNFDDLLPDKEILKKLNMAGWLSIGAGALVTLLVQSSSVITYVLTPLTAANMLTLENMLPFTIGANIGATVIALIAACANGKVAGIQIALVNFYFNVFGMIIWFPFERSRTVVLSAARFLGKVTYYHRLFPFLFSFIVFLWYPMYVWLGAFVIHSGNDGGILAFCIMSFWMFVSHLGAYLDFFEGGKQKLLEIIERKEKEIKRKQYDSNNDAMV